MNTKVTRSTKKTPYEIVFGQRANTFHNISMEAPSVNLSGLEDIVESQLEEEEVEEERNVEFSVSQRKGTQQSESSSPEIDRKRRKLLNFSICDPINIVDKEAFEVTCPVREEIRQSVKKNLEKSREKMEKKYNSSKKVETSEYNVGDKVHTQNRQAFNICQKIAMCCYQQRRWKTAYLQVTNRIWDFAEKIHCC